MRTTAIVLACAASYVVASLSDDHTRFQHHVKRDGGHREHAKRAGTVSVKLTHVVRPIGSRGVRRSLATRAADAAGVHISSHRWSFFTADITTGSGASAQTFSVVVDSGSALLLLGINPAKAYRPGHSAVVGLAHYTASYGDGSVSSTGIMTLDNTELVPGMGVRAHFGAASVASSKSLWAATRADGILGLAPSSMLQLQLGKGWVTYPDELVKNKIIDANIVTVLLWRAAAANQVSGEVIFGGYDKSHNFGSYVFSPRVDIGGYPYWGVHIGIPSLLVSHSSISGAIAHVDTGTTLCYLETSAFRAWARTVKGAVIDEKLGMISVPKGAQVPVLHFQIAGHTFALGSEAQLLPEYELVGLGLDRNRDWSIWSDGGSTSEGSYTLGARFIEQFSVVFDRVYDRIGFAYKESS
ncbi:uncharacterized protein L969DRAFT_92849 [Mixia osmundae IAM 14324]|uniref:Peptidase A1 domain-containing protein n=1 Tax=Mixia osmundae (strain CBS 9802 / IAM 14324 / JCM 22182 / KY 12970) TaxID=764103 RepID=G7DYR4_MIXOS|nr:uncharacterized protein L969DRAFT_92849 [Mixia osmundae IAM 14324]KEI41623.1 hypothetical protein L969DRAFT_92849 [Mixia osmundae IAM 14324]GAA95724.1 hypothetical protein E5Q_02381 [Mixia osmundae IAM 14324]